MRVWFALPIFLVTLSGCLSGDAPGTEDRDGRTPLEAELADAEWAADGPYSQVLQPGPYGMSDVEAVAFPSHDGTSIAAGVWRPDVPDGVEVPVILMVSPYWSTGLYSADARTQEFFLDGIGSHGYAFAKVAVRGTSFSGGCMESMGPNEQRDMDEIVTWFGTQEWSDGNVAIIGLSYVGSTPWAAAQWGNPHLKTIVPMSGVTDWFGLGFRNGTAEPRSPIHMALYWGQYGVANQGIETVQGDDAVHLLENVCEEAAWSVAAGPMGAATGGPGPDRFDQYWAVRNYQDRVAAAYNGTVFLVHGLRDWNVNIDMAVPFVTELQAAGIQVKWLLGQWQHAWPDQVSRGDHVRLDFAEVLLRWFDVHLKGMDRDTGPAVDVEDSHGLWRTESTWPPEDVTWTTWHLGDGVLVAEETPPGTAMAAHPTGAFDPIECAATGATLPTEVPGTEWRFRTGPLDAPLRIAGPIRLHATVTPMDPTGGQLYAELWEVTEAGWYRAAHGAMDLRFHEGGHEGQTITPGQSIIARMEFYPADILVATGSDVVLRIVPDTSMDPCVAAREQTSENAIQRPFLPGPSAVPLTLHWGDGSSVLHMPTIDRDVGDGRYPGQPRAA